MNKKELILQTLEKMGYKPMIDNDGDIMLYYQMKSVFVLAGNEEEKYVCVMLPQFYEIKDGEEILVLTICNKITRELKLAKVYIDQTFKNVTATCEFFYTNEETLQDCLTHSLELIGVVRSVFRKNKTEMSS